MSIAAPDILLPTAGLNYTTDVASQTLSGTTSATAERIRVNGSTAGVSYTTGDTVWSWTGTIVLGVNNIAVVAVERTTGNLSPETTISITLIQSDTFTTISSPTGIEVKGYQDQVEVVCTKNPEPQTLGYNFWVSYVSGGNNGAYVKINTQLVTDYTTFEDITTQLNQSVDTNGNIRVTTTTEEIERVYYYTAQLTRDRYAELVSAGLLPDLAFEEDTKFFFVVTAVVYDPILGQVSESTFSSELESSVVSITTGIKDLPARTQSDIITTISEEILLSNSGTDTKPGTVLRDIIDPVTEEMARIYIIQDFLARANSVSALQDFDDADGDGESDPVNKSVKKKTLQVALNLSNPADVQVLIDEQFDKLASNVDVIRKDAAVATGQVTFYVVNPPIRDMRIYEGAVVSSVGDLDTGIPSQTYKVMATKILEYANREDFYNSTNNRYEVTADVEAVTAGESGNTESYAIKNNVSGVDSDFQVENPNPISFGTDKETNHDLAARIQLAMFADTGTEGGYAKTAIAVPGVRAVRVEKAGDELMMRDYDTLRKTHIGGKVDIYIWGRRTRQVSDQLAFAFESISGTQGTQQGETFSVINTASYQFQCRNTRVGPHTPIFEVTQVYNATKGKAYDISGYQIIGEGNTVDLNEAIPTNISIGLASRDVIKVDYKFRSSDVFVLVNQPVDEIISVVGEISGPLTTDNYELVSLQDPLDKGRSTGAQDGIRIKYANNLPLTQFQTISEEEHVMVYGVDEALDYIGADTETIYITNEAKNIVYVENQDYSVTAGTEATATTITVIEAGHISNGQRVLISYQSIENFTITYSTNALLNDVQGKVDLMKHACADVIVKAAVENKIDMIITIVPKANVTNLNLLTSKIRTAISNYISQLDIGVSLTQSELIYVIQNIADVDYMILPFTRMVKADGSFIVRDLVGKVSWQIFNTGQVQSYITSASVLSFSTINNGGDENSFRGVFENNEALVLQDDALNVSEAYGRAYIRNDGKLIVSTKDGELPDTKSYEASYYVFGETGTKDISVTNIEYLSVGNLTIIYDNPRKTTQQTL